MQQKILKLFEAHKKVGLHINKGKIKLLQRVMEMFSVAEVYISHTETGEVNEFCYLERTISCKNGSAVVDIKLAQKGIWWNLENKEYFQKKQKYVCLSTRNKGTRGAGVCTE